MLADPFYAVGDQFIAADQTTGVEDVTVTDHSFELNTTSWSTVERCQLSNGNAFETRQSWREFYRPPTELPHLELDKTPVLVFYVNVFTKMLETAPAEARWIFTGNSTSDYFNYFTAALETSIEQIKPFVVLNHDVICRPDVLNNFASCPESWCMHRYTNEPNNIYTGCGRIRPEIAPHMLEICYGLKAMHRHQGQFGKHLHDELERDGVLPHIHTPTVTHLDYWGHMPCQ